MSRFKRILVVIAIIVSVTAGSLVVPSMWRLYAQDTLPQLMIVDRTESQDGLYYCSINYLKTDPVETVGLILKNRQGEKVGDMLLGTIDTSDTERMAAVFLNHELIKNSLALITFSDDRPNLKLVFGEQRAIRKQDGKAVQVPIE